MASFHSRTRQLDTTPFSTKGSDLANSSAASRELNTAIDPSRSLKVPIIRSVP